MRSTTISDDHWTTTLGLLGVLLLVLANGFFVAAEFSLVAVRRSRVAELVAEGRANAAALLRATDRLDAHLAATQFGITLSSLALGWVGEPALAHLVEPALAWLPGGLSAVAAHTIAVAVAFVIITALHIVLGELAPKSLALQRSERTALAVIRPLGAFLFLFRPAIAVLNGLGNGVLRLCGLQPGHGEGAHHSTAELRLLVAASQEAGLIHETQHEAVDRIFALGDRTVRSIMTPRHEVAWLNLGAPPEDTLRLVRDTPHAHLPACRGMIDDVFGVVAKQALLDQVLDGQPPDAARALQAPTVVPETMPVLAVLDLFRSASVRMALVIDEYGTLEGIVTQTDLLEAIAGELARPGEPGSVEAFADGSLVLDGMLPAADALHRLGIPQPGKHDDYATLAGFILSRLGHVPSAGEFVLVHGWRLDILAMARRRIDKVRATRDDPAPGQGPGQGAGQEASPEPRQADGGGGTP